MFYSIFQVSFMIPGHTKFAPDLFSQIAKSYYKTDVCKEDNLQLVAQQFSHVVIDRGGIVRMWREKVGEKYTSLPGIWELHDLLRLQCPLTKSWWRCKKNAIAEHYVTRQQRSERISMPLIHVYPRLQTLIVPEEISDPYLKTRWGIFNRCMLTLYHKRSGMTSFVHPSYRFDLKTSSMMDLKTYLMY